MSDPSDQGRFELAGWPVWVIDNADSVPLRGTGRFADGEQGEYLIVFTDEAQGVECVE
jgi:hypothetical protein